MLPAMSLDFGCGCEEPPAAMITNQRNPQSERSGKSIMDDYNASVLSPHDLDALALNSAPPDPDAGSFLE